MTKFIGKYRAIFAIIGIAVIWISLNLTVHLLTGNHNLDMTDNNRYSLSAYSKEQVRELSLPVYITVYYSSDIAMENPLYGKYAEFILRFLEQYHNEAPDKVFISVKNPEPYSTAEKEAVQSGIEAIASRENGNLYFGIVFSDLEGKTYKIPSISIDRNFWLEKDITSILSRFNESKRKIVGLISPIHKMIKREYGKGTESSAFIQELTSHYDVLELETNISEVPAEVSVMMVVVPQKMPRTLTYALEQYVLRGGSLILLCDVLVENPYYKTSFDTVADINKLLKNWGLVLSDSLLGSQVYGKKTLFGDKSRHLLPYPLWLDLSAETFNSNHPLFDGLKQLEFRSASELTALPSKESDRFTLTPLITLDEGGLYPFSEYSFNPREVLNRYVSDDKKHSPVWLAEGYFQSAFNEAPETAKDSVFSYLYYSARPGRVLIFGDSDFLRDDVWLEGDKLNDNGQLVLRAIEYFNNTPGMAALNKSQNGDLNKPLGARIYEQVLKASSEDVLALNNELDNLLNEQEQLLKEVRDGSRKMDIDLSTRLNSIRDRVQDIEKQLSWYNFQIKNSFISQTQSIVFANLAVIPLLLLILIIFINRKYANYCRKKIEEKFNVSR